MRTLLLLFLPLAPLLHYVFHAPALVVFTAGIIGVGVLADWIRLATEKLAHHIGSAMGGLLSVSLGSLAELILALFVLADGHGDVVHAQITGSIIGTGLLGLGMAIIAGGMGREKQAFKVERARLLSGLLTLVLIALLLPAVFDMAALKTHRDAAMHNEAVSLCVSVVLLFLYGANLVHTLVTHRDVFAESEGPNEGGGWPVSRCLGVLTVATVAAAWEAELVSDALTDAAQMAHLSPVFLGVIALALVGTIADLFSAVFFARKDQMGAVMSICIGSAIQVALVVAPILVIVSWLMGRPFNLVFQNPMELFAIGATALIVNAVAGDGETNWFEGVLLVGVYLLMAVGFFFLG